MNGAGNFHVPKAVVRLYHMLHTLAVQYIRYLNLKCFSGSCSRKAPSQTRDIGEIFPSELRRNSAYSLRDIQGGTNTVGQAAKNIENDITWWIDDGGRWLNFGAEYANRFPECYFPKGEHRHGPAFDMLGMVKVTDYPRLIDVHWDIRHVTPGALDAVLNHLIRLDIVRNEKPMIALKFFFGAWNSELYDSPDKAVDRILELSEYADVTPSNAITIANVDLDRIGYSHPLVREFYDRWRAMDGILESGPSGDLGGLKDRSLILGLDSLDERLIYRSAGKNSMAGHLLGSDWPFEVLGMEVDRCNSDDEYESEVCSDYPDVLVSGEPRLDHIRAFFQLDGDDPMWLNYQRLLLPWKTRSGEPLVMCFSQPSQTLEVPFLEAATEEAA